MARKKLFATEINNETLNQVVDYITDQEIEKIDQDILSKDQIKLKKIAITFLSTVNEVQIKIQNIEKMMLAQKKLRNQIRNELKVTGKFLSEYETDEYRKNKEELNNELRSQEVEKLYRAAFTFHTEVNKILEQEVITILALPNKQGNLELFHVTEEELFNNNILSFEETSKTSRLTARFKVTAEQMRAAGFRALNRDDLNIEDKLNVNNLNVAYKTILQRYDKYKRLVLWLFPTNPKTWWHSKISARGDIAEAYSMFFLKKAEYDFNSIEPETNIHYFMVEGVADVDNISGLLQGDISDGQFEYAIKSADASYMSIQQIIPLAEDIINNKNYSKEDLLKYKEELKKRKSKKARNEIKEGIGDAASEYISEMFNF